ncbi:MAG: UvrB/UvrC motif-containing protein [Clostridia bacterium]|nr:UvrB/UvrC motif-containing protein [Clostridia bacterium]
MLCQKCNKNEANVKYTEVINGEKKEMMLCEQCSHELGLDNISFNMPINFSSFLGGLLEDETYNTPEFMPLFQQIKQLKCDNCNLTYDEFINQGKFGCAQCYDVFSNKIDSLLKRIHGSNEYLGRKAINSQNINKNIENEKEVDENSENKKLKELQEDLKKAIADERYEDAAKIRDKIKKIEE